VTPTPRDAAQNGDRCTGTNRLFLTGRAFGIVAAWYLLPKKFALGADRFVWEKIKEMKWRRAHTGLCTVAYRTPYRVHYQHFGVPVPAGAKVLEWDEVGNRVVARRDEAAREPGPGASSPER
jgi:hypothetical protein